MPLYGRATKQSMGPIHVDAAFFGQVGGSGDGGQPFFSLDL